MRNVLLAGVMALACAGTLAIQSALAQKAGGISQARLSALELNPGRFTLER